MLGHILSRSYHTTSNAPCPEQQARLEEEECVEVDDLRYPYTEARSLSTLFPFAVVILRTALVWTH